MVFNVDVVIRLQLFVQVYTIPCDQSVVGVRTTKDGIPSYGIVRTDYSSQKPKLKCQSSNCKRQALECEHVNAVLADILEGQNHIQGIKEHLHKAIKYRPAYVPVAVSETRIPFGFSETSDSRWKHVHYNILIPDTSGSCPCGSPWSDKDPVECGWLDSEGYIFGFREYYPCKSTAITSPLLLISTCFVQTSVLSSSTRYPHKVKLINAAVMVLGINWIDSTVHHYIHNMMIKYQ